MFLVQQESSDGEWANISAWTDPVMAAAQFLAHTGHDIDPNDLAVDLSAGSTFESFSALNGNLVRVIPNPVMRTDRGPIE